MDIDFGQILPYPTDAPYNATTNYGSMWTCLDQYKSEWLSLVDNNKGHALPGYNADGSAKTSDYWRCIVNVYRTGASANNADAKAALAEEKANLANDKATLADQAARLAEEKAAFAQQQGENARNQIEGAENVDATLNGNILSITNRNGSTKTVNVKGEKGDKGEGLDYSSMTTAEKQELAGNVADKVAEEGGYALIPVKESTLSPSSTFVKNAIICIDGVIYRAKSETNTLPFNFMADDGKFVVQTILGHTCFVKVTNTLNSDWEVWIDASCDLRFKQLEERIARLETIINSL